MPPASDRGDSRPEVRSITEGEHFSRRLSQVQDYLMKVKRAIEQKEIDMCVLEGHGERHKSINFDLQSFDP